MIFACCGYVYQYVALKTMLNIFVQIIKFSAWDLHQLELDQYEQRQFCN